ncbi:LuxR family transcriptional regulator [Muribaculaceae bacterium Isolate-105 (HZI)]|nr:LuxR family transcriptional regulator [Muribaculaceae bacterium Isolate-105 (HZI)]
MERPLKQLDRLLRQSPAERHENLFEEAMTQARSLATLENVVAVISDMTRNESRIIAGGFAKALGLDGYEHENSIWESRILSMMTEEQQEAKVIAELRFYHLMRHLPKARRQQHCLISRLRMHTHDDRWVDVMHRMYYVHDPACDNVLYAICLYGPMMFDFKGSSYMVDMTTGIREELSAEANGAVLSRRERQVLSLIDEGMKSVEIARRLNISVHTVSRHRQEILAKLQVKNSIEACRRAKAMKLI